MHRSYIYTLILIIQEHDITAEPVDAVGQENSG